MINHENMVSITAGYSAVSYKVCKIEPPDLFLVFISFTSADIILIFHNFLEFHSSLSDYISDFHHKLSILTGSLKNKVWL